MKSPFTEEEKRTFLWILIAIVVGMCITVGIIGIWEGIINLLRN